MPRMATPTIQSIHVAVLCRVEHADGRVVHHVWETDGPIDQRSGRSLTVDMEFHLVDDFDDYPWVTRSRLTDGEFPWLDLKITAPMRGFAQLQEAPDA